MDDINKLLEQELQSMALRLGISDYVYIYSYDKNFGYIGGNKKGSITTSRVIGLIEMTRTILHSDLIDGIKKTKKRGGMKNESR